MHAITHIRQATLFRLLVAVVLVATAFITTTAPAEAIDPTPGPTVSNFTLNWTEDGGDMPFSWSSFTSHFSGGTDLTEIKLESLPQGNGDGGWIMWFDTAEYTSVSATQWHLDNTKLKYRPESEWSGSVTLDWYGKNSSNEWSVSPATVTINVSPVNDPMWLIAPAGPLFVNEDTALSFVKFTSTAIAAGDDDLNGGEFEISLSVISGTLTLASTTGLTFSAGDGTNDAAMTFTGTYTDTTNGALNGMTYQGNLNWYGSDTMTINASDQGNTGGPATTDQKSFTINVNPVNDPPDAVDDYGATIEDEPVTINVLANDSDAENDPFHIIQVTNGLYGTVTNNGNGTVTYTPALDYSGTDTFTYTITDAKASSGDSTNSPYHCGADTATVSMYVEDINDPPVAVDDSATVPADRTSDILVLDNDSDPDDVGLAVSDYTQPAHGSVEAFAGGIVRYTPDAGYTGPDSFSYTVTDGREGFDSADVSVTVAADAEAPPTQLIFQMGAGGYFGSGDTYIDLGNPGTAWGGADRLRVKTTQNADALVTYDLSALPAGTTVNSATLRLWVIEQIGSAPVKQAFARARSVPITLRAFPVLKAWDESAATWYAATGLDSWGAPGCQAPGVDYASEYVDELIAFDLVQNWVEFDITELAQQWVDDPTSNFGVVIKGYLHRMTVSYSFWSSQGPLPALRPQLEISYELPE